MRHSEARGRLATALVVAAAVLAVGATVAGYARHAVFNSGQFADRATASLHDSSVRSLVAERLTDGLVLKDEPDLLAARPLIISTVSALVGGKAFASLFHRGALDAHRAIFDHDQSTVSLTLLDVGTVAGAALTHFKPRVAATLERAGRISLLKRGIGNATGSLTTWADRIRVISWILSVLALLAVAGALVLSVDRRHTAREIGIGLAGAGLAIVVLYTVARAALLGSLAGADDRAAASAVWSVFLGDLRGLGFLFAGAGAVLAAAASSLIRPLEVDGALKIAWRVARSEPVRTGPRLGRAAGLIAVGLLVITQPLAALQVLAIVIGALILYEGLETVLRLINGPARAEIPEPEPDARHRPHPRLRFAAAGGVALALVAAPVAIFAEGGATTAPPQAITKCNGHAELCDRTLSEVVLPATHNSMSVPLPGWFSSEQDRPIGGQLADGIRGLLLDTHDGDKLPNGKVRTDFGSQIDLEHSAAQDGVAPKAVNSALRLRARLGFKGNGNRGMYLCHSFCELGATALSTGLKDIHDFLASHPDEVVVLVNQDYVTPADFVKAIGAAGLTPYVDTDPDPDTEPTLREMIEQNHRLVLLAENHAGGAPWYQLAYRRLVNETPYSFTKSAALTDPAQLATSCRANRGPARAPLFLINDWVTTDPFPLPSNAAKVNAYAPLLRRARECQRLRGHLPNLLAVNFYKRGDLFRVVDTLNGVGAG